ncbi:MAG: substrate-binding domain-containing protein [Micrococcales bacterium]|nr:substrate-binding domain-containing protein [Micrococcales bacterium]
MKIRQIAVGAALPLCALAACSSNPGHATTPTGGPTAAVQSPANTGTAPDASTGAPTLDAASAAACQGKKIAYLTASISVPYWRSLAVGVDRVAKQAGATVTDYDSNLDSSTQLRNAQDAITAGVDAIIISPTDSTSAPVVLDAAKAAGVPVVIADVGTDSGDYVSFVQTDNVKGAAAAGDYLNQLLAAKDIKNAQIGMIAIEQTRQNGRNRTKGFTDAVEGAGHTVLPLLESKQYTRSEGMSLAQDLITGNPNMVALFTQHDEATLGALTALETANDLDKIILVGFDGSPDTLQAIEDGKVKGASMQQPVLMGNDAMVAVCQYLGGTAPDKAIYVPTIMVTTDNVASVKATVMDTVFATE